MIDELRQYIRHPSDMRIECSIPDTVIEGAQKMCNVSKTGLCFMAKARLPAGSRIHLKIPLNDINFEVDGIVMWCNDMDDYSEIGVKFTDDATEFSVRMIEQLCHIEQYRQQVLETEGRQLSSEAAGREWVHKFAADFTE